MTMTSTIFSRFGEGARAHEQLLVIEPTKAATLFLLLFFFCLTELENVGRHFSFYTSATGIVCYTAFFFFSSRNASPSLPFPPLLVKIEESRVTTKNGWVAAVSLRKDRIIIRFWETAFLPHP